MHNSIVSSLQSASSMQAWVGIAVGDRVGDGVGRRVGRGVGGGVGDGVGRRVGRRVGGRVGDDPPHLLGQVPSIASFHWLQALQE